MTKQRRGRCRLRAPLVHTGSHHPNQHRRTSTAGDSPEPSAQRQSRVAEMPGVLEGSWDWERGILGRHRDTTSIAQVRSDAPWASLRAVPSPHQPQHLPLVPGALLLLGGQGSPANRPGPESLGVLLLLVLHMDPWRNKTQPGLETVTS